jgi:hypothetical protein
LYQNFIQNKMAFQEVVQSIPAISNCHQQGKQALGAYSQKVDVGETRQLCGSVNLDVCLHNKYPDANRWDYILCYRNKAYFIEVHPAITSEVGCVIRKFQWLKNWLKVDGIAIYALMAQDNPYHWIASGNVAILKNSPQARMLSLSGLPFPKERLFLQ